MPPPRLRPALRLTSSAQTVFGGLAKHRNANRNSPAACHARESRMVRHSEDGHGRVAHSKERKEAWKWQERKQVQ
jgi:hypothetical protein